MQRLRRALAELIVGHPDPLRLIDRLAAMASERDLDRRRQAASLERRLERAEARISELYVDGSIVAQLEAAYDRRKGAAP